MCNAQFNFSHGHETSYEQLIDVCYQLNDIRSNIRLQQDTGGKYYSHNNRGEAGLCGVVLVKLTRPFTAFDMRLTASHNGRHIILQASSGKLKCHRFS